MVTGEVIYTAVYLVSDFIVLQISSFSIYHLFIFIFLLYMHCSRKSWGCGTFPSSNWRVLLTAISSD